MNTEGVEREMNEETEKQRSILWRVVIVVSTVLIIGIGGFFLVKMFTDNPLKGTWAGTDLDVIMEISGDDALVLSQEGEEGVSVTMDVTMDRDNKSLTLRYGSADEDTADDAENAASDAGTDEESNEAADEESDGSADEDTMDGTGNGASDEDTAEAAGEESGEAAAESADSALAEIAETLEGTYTYSVDGTVLTLTELEYGDQLTFEMQ